MNNIDLNIDLRNIKDECIKLPSEFFTVMESQRKAKREVAKCKDLLNLVLAESSLRVREALKEMKTTESIISATVETQKEVQNARKELRNAEEDLKKCDVLVECMIVKREELSNLVKLVNNDSYISTVTMGNK